MKLYRMRYLILLLLAALLMQLLSACEQVIEVNLNDASPRYVIEGSITDEAGPYQIRITRTKNFDEDNTFEGVTGAVVLVSDNAGNMETLQEHSPGIYTGSIVPGVPGRSYFLNVLIGEERFTATSTMPALVPFEDLYIEEQSTFGEARKVPYAVFTDPAGEPNYYRFLLTVSGRRVNVIYAYTDQYTDGRQVKRSLRYFTENEDDDIKTGDQIEVEMQSIDSPVYTYFYSLSQTIGQNAAAPGNPVSNITGGALGYFSAHTVQRKSIAVE
ncbi:DUF4249 domain-containing protein [Pontibacter sp. SGAir0037]|uniref:DUF4249 domain-containing protein n=1 Tax=Pontibacter sp. SGAir0037 TaxID=2571030 RepID=UPI0010CD2B9C|nr:DUF4249 domain-containing protein [Pontibacter sp. SGAir0037]QCR21251.1 DUF4249 domain-containing protein [Pontibacter sp. SGAir0037]